MAINIAVDAINEDDAPGDEVYLGDDGPYWFRFPKIGPLTNVMRRMSVMKDQNEAGMMMLDAQMKWLERGFDEEVWEYILERVDDEDDALDFSHLVQVFQSLVEAASNRPTISPSGSSRQPRQKPRSVVRSAEDSASVSSAS